MCSRSARRGLLVSAVIWLLAASSQPAFGELIPDKLLRGFAEAGRICLAAEHERDVEPALAVIRSMKVELAQAKASQADLSRVEGALNFLLKWQTYLGYRDTESWGKAGAMVMHLSNLAIGHLMIPRFEIRDRLTKFPLEKLGPPAAPENVHRVRDEDDESGSFDLVWTNGAEDAEHCEISQEDGYGGYREVAILPPNIDNYHPFTRDAKPSSAEALAVQRAAAACLRANQLEELEPALKDLASYSRGARSAATPSERAEQSRIDCALLFVGWWQDSLTDLRAGRKEEAAKRLRRLASTNRDYPVLEPQFILQRATAADPNVGDFVADSDR
ncbi:MAG: hypothetical protein V7609_2560 [Verrucomicrobiota bacterium]